jgi:serine/threonine-protein kinase
MEGVEAGKTYLCEQCASPLSANLSGTFAAPDLPDPDEVRRAATNPKNVVGKYVVVKELGHGSMGAVYKAWDTAVRRWVALKILVAVGNRELLMRFHREAETAAALQHPGIVPIYDVGEAGGLPYIAMRHIEGETLKGKMHSVRTSCDVVAQAARAVGHAHRQKIVHRDLKPGNLMMDAAGRIYVMDFGLAKDLFGASQLTAPGTVLGTPSYMAPEQAAGKIQQVDERSDVYSLGAILYELLTGRAPFRGDRLVDTIRQVMHDPVVPIRSLRAEVPDALERIVLRALEKDKAKRFESADALADALEMLLVESPPRHSSKAVTWVLALAGAGAAGAFAAWYFLRG